MPAIKNITKAFEQINKKMLEHQGELTSETAQSFFDSAVKEFNLDEVKVAELKQMEFRRDTIKKEPKPTKQKANEPKEEIAEPTLEEVVASQALEIANLTACLSEIATLTGYANYLGKYGLKRTEPAKRK